jgi:signal transduction histidine kinase
MVKRITHVFANLRIGQKLAVGFGLLIVLALAIVVANLVVQDMQNTAHRRADDAQRVALLAANLQSATTSVRYEERSFYARRLIENYEAAYPSYELADQYFGTALDHAAAIKTILPADEHQDIDAVIDTLQRFQAALSSIVTERIPQRGEAGIGKAGDLLTSLEQIDAALLATGQFQGDTPAANPYDAARDYVRLPDLDSVTRFNKGLNALRAALDDMDLSAEEREDLRAQINTIFAQFAALVKEDGQLWTDTEALDVIAQELDARVNDFVPKMDQKQDEAAADLKHAQDIGRTIQLVIAVLVLVLGLSLAFVMGRIISQPLTRLTSIARIMAGGNYQQRIHLTRQDEVGQLARAFNEMADAIQANEVALRGQAERLAQTNEDLLLARQQADDANRLKSEFVATMSHELRTPLNAIIGYSQIILSGMTGDLDAKQHRFMGRIFSNSCDLLRLIDDILDLSRIEAGRMELVRKPFAVKSWLDDIVQEVQPKADEKPVALLTEIDRQMPPVIVGDADRLRQIALNLLTNAFKFTEQGTVKIRLQRRESEAWELIVSDTGIGIPPHAQEYIFEEFRQVDGTTQRKHGGSGLGLAIVRHLARSMSGTVRLQSEVGQGSTFTVRLPLTIPDPTHEVKTQPIIARP